MSSQIILDANEKAKVKISVPTDLNKIYHTARARIYWARAGTKKWSYAGIQGALVFVLNTTSNTLHFQMIDLDGDRGVIWDYELYDGLVLDQEKSVTFFLSFEGDVGGEKRTIGFVFMDDSEAKTFCNDVKNNKDTKSSKLNRPSLITPPPSLPAARTQSPQVAPHRPISPVVEDDQSRPPPLPRRPIAPTPACAQPPPVASHRPIIPVVEDGQSCPLPLPRRPIAPTPSRTQPPPVAPHRPISPVVKDDQSRPPPLPRRPIAPTPARTQPPPMAPRRPISPVIEDEQLPPTPPPRPPTPTHGAPSPSERPFPPQPREMESKQTTTVIPYSRPRYLKSPPSPLVLYHSNSLIMSNSPPITPSHSASTSSVGTVIRQQESHRNQPGDLPFLTEEVPEDGVESDITQAVQFPFKRSWISHSRIPRASKPVGEFMKYMAGRRRQTNDSDESSTSPTPQIPRYSITSSVFYPSLSASSSPPGDVFFSATPRFKDVFLKGIMQMVTSPPLDSSMSHGFVNLN